MYSIEEIENIIEQEYQRKINLGIGCSNGFCDIIGKRKGQHTNSSCSCLYEFGKENQLAIRRRFQLKDMIIRFLLDGIGDEFEVKNKILALNRRI